MDKRLNPEESIVAFMTAKRYNLFNCWGLFENDRLGGRRVKVVSWQRMPKGIDLMMVDTDVYELDENLPDLSTVIFTPTSV